MSSNQNVSELIEKARRGQARAVARLISLVEDAGPARGDAATERLREIAVALTPLAGHARVIGITGSPGVGKSTSTSVLVSALRERGCRVGVLAVDPSSPFSGGALLGDRIRMQDHALDDGVYIRSMATRGHLGGVAAATGQALRVLDAAGCDVVLIETVGVGQSEMDVVTLADSTLVLLAPGMGDGIQAAKAGILEVADVFVVNKADRDGADQVVRDLKHMVSLGRQGKEGPSWRQQIVTTVASRGEGVADVLAAIDAHHQWMTEHGELERRRRTRAEREIESIAVATLRAEMGDLRGGDALAQFGSAVLAGEMDPFTAADRLIAGVRSR